MQPIDLLLFPDQPRCLCVRATRPLQSAQKTGHPLCLWCRRVQRWATRPEGEPRM